MIVATYDKSLFTAAAQAESLTAAQAKAIVAAAPAGWLPTLVNHVSDPAAQGSSLAQWRAAFPQILNTGSDNADSFLIRVAVAAAGGVVV